MQLYDAFTVDGVRRTSDGYLAAFARVARTGIQEYRGAELGRPDLDKVRVYRPAEEVFSADALRSFAHRPVTLRHPNVPVTAKNWKKHAGGQTGDEVVRDGEYVRVPMVMMDQALIDAYERDGVKELSMGYSTDIKWTAGVTDAGEEYDAIQTAIRGNHLAVVPVARGGDQLRIGDGKNSALGDEAVCPECGAEMTGKNCPECNYVKDNDINEGDYPMKLVIDGVPVNVADDQSGAIIERHIASLTQKLKDAAAEGSKAEEEAESAKKELEEKKKGLDAKDGEIAVLKKKVEDSAVTPEKLDVMVKARASVIDKAKVVVGDKYVFDGKTVEQIRKDTVVVHLGDDAKSMSDGAIEGAFMAITKDTKPADSTQQIGDALLRRPHSSTGAVDARDAAIAERDKALQESWKAA